MKAIVVEYVPPWVPLEKRLSGRPNGDSRFKSHSARPRADLSQHCDGDQGIPPYWTWFIENPRDRNYVT
ncbi:MAG TPA: hypothetical protein VJS88_08115 [Chthoniobacterales bacterium]|nr:hypothetical protein [Chthoniobacterales bacterium]